jgi:hypothetical protein
MSFPKQDSSNDGVAGNTESNSATKWKRRKWRRNTATGLYTYSVEESMPQLKPDPFGDGRLAEEK